MHRPRLGNRETIPFRRELRRQPTTAEKILWAKLRSKQLLGLKFRRQHGVGPYIADFYCAEKRAIIEIDGDVHALPTQEAKDTIREEFFKKLGYYVFRYCNDDVIRNTNAVLEDLIEKLDDLPHPSLKGGEEG